MEHETTISPLATNSQPKGNMTNIILIVVIVCIVGLFLLGIIILVLLIRRRKHKKQDNSVETMYENSEVDDAIHAYGNTPAIQTSNNTDSGTILNNRNTMNPPTSVNSNHLNYSGFNMDRNHNSLELPPKRVPVTHTNYLDTHTSNTLHDANRQFGKPNIAYIGDHDGNLGQIPKQSFSQADRAHVNMHTQQGLNDYPKVHSNNHFELTNTGRGNASQYDEYYSKRKDISSQYEHDREILKFNRTQSQPPFASIPSTRQNSNYASRNPVSQVPWTSHASNQMNQNVSSYDERTRKNQNLKAAHLPNYSEQASRVNYTAENEIPIQRSISYPPNEVSIPYSNNDRNVPNLNPYLNINNDRKIQNPWSNVKENPVSKPEAIYAIAEINQTMKQRHTSESINGSKPPQYANVSSLNRPKVKTLYDDAGAQYADINTTTTGTKSRRSRSRNSSFHKESHKSARARSHSFHKDPRSTRNRHDSFHRDYPDDHILQKEIVYASLGRKKGSNFEHIASNENLSTVGRKSSKQFVYKSNKLSPEDVAELYASPLKLKKKPANYDEVQLHNMTYHPSQDRTRKRTDKPTYAELI